MANGFKILQVISRQLWSYAGKMVGNIRYFTNKTVRPKDNEGPLYVFDTLEHAEDFLQRESNRDCMVRIYECEYEPEVCVRQSPLGTRFASSVKLLKKVC